MEVAEALARSSLPVALIWAERDTVVPPRRTEAVRRSARELLMERVIRDAGHNDLYDRPEFKEALREALALLEGSSG
jgi:pimeloyl-ACP methyl ester carboxylesterase